MRVLISDLKKSKIFLDVQTMFVNIDRCANQYHCATAIHILSILTTEFNITINRAVDASIHGKDIVYGLNSYDKKDLNQMMTRITFPGNEETFGEDKNHTLQFERTLFL